MADCYADSNRTIPPDSSVSRAFLLGAAGAACVIVGWCVLIARREWFLADDLIFLSLAQEPRSWEAWKHVFLPLDTRFWWSYRPLSIDVFFRLGFLVFGRAPFGYLLVSLAVHFATGFLVYRLALQLGFHRRVAIVAALLSVCRYPSMTQGFWISVFQHVAANGFFLLAVSLFLDYARGAGRFYQVAACLALVLALLCNELGATLPAVLVLVAIYAGEFRLTPRALWRVAISVTPHLLITAVYLVLRLRLFGPTVMKLPGFNTPFLGWHILGNYGQYVRFMFGNSAIRLLIGGLLATAICVSVAAGGRQFGPLFKWLVQVNALCVGWIAVVMVPFVGFGWAHPRFAISMEAPACLLFGAYLNALCVVYAGRSAAVLEVGLICLVFAAIPYGVLWKRAHELQGVHNQQLIDLLESTHPHPPKGSCVMLLYGSRGLATRAEAQDFRFRVGYNWLLRAFYGDPHMRLLFHDVRRGMPARRGATGCFLFTLKPDLTVGVLGPVA